MAFDPSFIGPICDLGEQEHWEEDYPTEGRGRKGGRGGSRKQSNIFHPKMDR
jgi:hypothetical protein